MKLTVSQQKMLDELRRRESAGLKPEWFAPNMTIVRALDRRGLIKTHFIGQRWWTILLTASGRRSTP